LAFSYYGDSQRGWPLRRLSCTNAKLVSPQLIAPVISAHFARRGPSPPSVAAAVLDLPGPARLSWSTSTAAGRGTGRPPSRWLGREPRRKPFRSSRRRIPGDGPFDPRPHAVPRHPEARDPIRPHSGELVSRGRPRWWPPTVRSGGGRVAIRGSLRGDGSDRRRIRRHHTPWPSQPGPAQTRHQDLRAGCRLVKAGSAAFVTDAVRHLIVAGRAAG
jgi:hypothetical protein